MNRQPGNQKKRTIRDWWADNPMTYAATHGQTRYRAQNGAIYQVDLGSRAFFEAADATFYAWNRPLHTPEGRFARIFDYARYRGRPVLEVGCGMGCMAMNWAQQGARVTAVDLNPVAVAQTRQRFALYGLAGNICEADAEALPFADGAFDYVYSWGVLHHTPGIRQAIEELRRVLRPGGAVGVMLYHRHSLRHRYVIQYLEGYLNMESVFLDSLGLASRYTDGMQQEGNPHTWPVTKREVTDDLFARFRNVRVKVLGTDVPAVLNLMAPQLGVLLPRPLLKALARRWGWSLWITAER